MPAVIYMLRSVSQKVSPALYVPEDSVLTIDVANTTQAGIVRAINQNSSFEVEQPLSYKQLLDVLLDARKVITL